MANAVVNYEYDPKNMIFRNLGKLFRRVHRMAILRRSLDRSFRATRSSVFLGCIVKGDIVKDIIKTAFEAGINMIDTAEGYAGGQSEREIGRVLKELGYRRTDWIISTKIFFGVGRKGPNDKGLSRKHLIEGLNESLERLQMDYVDVVFAHRPDSTVPMVEIVRAFDYLINSGKAFYWATSEWSAPQINEAFLVAGRFGLIPPIADQCQYNCFRRQRFEVEYKPLYENYKYGTMVFSPLLSGFLTGKYNNGIPEDSRFAYNPEFFKRAIDSLTQEEGLAKIQKVRELTEVAQNDLNCTVAQLAVAWVTKNPNTSTVILGASKPEQLLETIKALD
ncbi:hypothetical protein FRB99_003259, partial [Tulasnella sp. 403]